MGFFLITFMTIFVLVFDGLSLAVLGFNYVLFGLGTVSWNNLFGLLFNYFFGLSYFFFCFSLTIFGLYFFGLGAVGWNNLFGLFFNNFLRGFSDNLLWGFGTVNKGENLWIWTILILKISFVNSQLSNHFLYSRALIF